MNGNFSVNVLIVGALQAATIGAIEEAHASGQRVNVVDSDC